MKADTLQTKNKCELKVSGKKLILRQEKRTMIS